MIRTDTVKLFFLFALALSQVFSSYLFLPGGESVGASVFRVLVVGLAGFTFIRSGFRHVGPIEARAITVMSALALWMLMSLFWSDDQSQGFRHILYIITTIILLYVLTSLIQSRQDYIVFAGFVALIGVFVTAFAFYEIETGFHFPSTTFDDVLYNPERAYMRQGQAWFTFGNPNDLAVHLTFTTSLMLLVLRRISVAAILAVLIIGVNVYLFQLLDARLAGVAILIFTLAYLFLLTRRNVQKFVFPVSMIPVGVMVALGTAISLSNAYELLDTSTFIRLKLVGAGVEMAVRSFLIGVGAGGFPAYIVDYGLTGQTYGIVDPHNAFARQLGENGIIGFSLFLTAVFGPVFVVARRRRVTKFGAYLLAITAVSPLLFMISSDAMSLSTLQLYLAMIWVGCRFVDQESDAPATQG